MTYQVWKGGIFSAECHCEVCVLVVYTVRSLNRYCLELGQGDVMPDNLAGPTPRLATPVNSASSPHISFTSHNAVVNVAAAHCTNYRTITKLEVAQIIDTILH